MFWRVPGYSQPSPLEAILDLDNFTLEEVLDEADLIQECKSLNGRLVNFLKEPSTLRALLSYIVDTPAPGVDEKQHQKNSFKSCEVLCCEVNEMYSVLMREEDLLEKLFSFLDNSKPLNLTRAGYFARVVSCLLMKRASEVLAFLESRRGIIDKLLAHLDTTSTAEVLCSVAGADERTAPNLTTPQLQWLAETNFMSGLVAQLQSEGNSDADSNARTVLVGVARSPLSAPLLQPLLDPSFFQPLLDSAFAAPVSVQIMDVLIALLKPRQDVGRAGLQQQSEANSPPGGLHSAFADASSSANAELDASIKQAAVQGVVGKLPHLAELLDADRAEGPDLKAPQDTPYGVLSPPLGQARLKAVEVLYSILGLSDPAAEQGVMDSSVIQRCLQLFTHFPFNNLLHHRVAGLVLTALERGSDEFLRYLFGACQLIQWLTQAPDLVVPASRSLDSRAEARAPLRAGYMGHITALANKLSAMADERPVIAEALGSSGQWGQWRDTVLQPRNEFEDVNRWACGRPSTQEMASRAASQEDPMMEDIEGMPAGGAARSLQSHRYGSFEENGDDDSDEEDVGRAFEMQGDDTIFQDAAATFRSLKLNDSFPAEGEPGNDDSSSSSSSNDEADVSLRMPPTVVMQRQLSDDEDMVVMDMDDYGVVVGSSGFENTNGAQPSFEPFASSQDPWKAFPDPPAQAEQAPEGAGWADFEGAAPFQAASSHAQPSEPAWASLEGRDASPKAETSPASFPGGKSPVADSQQQQQQQQQDTSQGSVPMQSAAQHSAAAAAPAPAPDAHQHSPPIDIPMSHGAHSPPEEAAELDEFSSFNYWRSPPAMLVDDADLARDSADVDSPKADSAESPAESPEAVEHTL